MTTIDDKERQELRRLAGLVAEAAARPVQQERTGRWLDHNSLRTGRPLVLAFPEGGWRELVREEDLICRDPLLRQWESHLRGQLFHVTQIDDDRPITNWFNIPWQMTRSDFGLPEVETRSDPLGAFTWDPPLKTRADFEQLHFRRMTVDRAETARRAALAEELFGGLLRVRVRGMLWWTMGLTQQLVKLRGLDRMMFDMYDEPQLLHDLMAFLRDAALGEIDYYEREGLLTLNNGPDDYVGSGGLGGTEELPAADFAGRVRPADMWVLGESQETVGVGPQQFAEFVLPYQLPILNKFGLVCYGCCEPLQARLDMLIAKIPQLRRVSISPWCDRAVAAERLGRGYIFSWKPNPALICAPVVDWREVERVTHETVALARGCCLEMIMKDTHTFCGDATRIGHWVKMAQRAALEG